MSEPSKTPREDVHVETGAFRIDRSRALEKLSKYQMRRPEGFLLPWVRCAVLSEAKEIRIDETPHGLDMRFNGASLSQRQLKRPYHSLFDGRDRDTDRNRQLAVGLLACLRTGPARVTITSGAGKDRLELEVETLKRDSFRRVPGGDALTSLRVSWDQSGVKRARECIAAAAEGWALVNIPILIGGRARDLVPKEAVRFGGRGRARGFVVAAALGQSPGLYFYKHGVLAERLDWSSPNTPARVHVNDDRFKLDLSQDSVVKDKLYGAALRRARRMVLERLPAAKIAVPDWPVVVLAPFHLLSAVLGVTAIFRVFAEEMSMAFALLFAGPNLFACAIVTGMVLMQGFDKNSPYRGGRAVGLPIPALLSLLSLGMFVCSFGGTALLYAGGLVLNILASWVWVRRG